MIPKHDNYTLLRHDLSWFQQHVQFGNYKTCLTSFKAVTSSLSSHPSSATKEHVKDVHGGREAGAAWASFLNCLLAALVINVPFLWIWKHFICLGYELKLQKKKREIKKRRFELFMKQTHHINAMTEGFYTQPPKLAGLYVIWNLTFPFNPFVEWNT